MGNRSGNGGPFSKSWSRKDQSSGRRDEEKQFVEISQAGLSVEEDSRTIPGILDLLFISVGNTY